MKGIACAVSVAVFVLGLACRTEAQVQFNKIVTFGDSLSDGGAYTNIIKALNVPGGSQVTRFKFTTNPGNVWVENLAQRFGLALTPNVLDGGTNYAEGGARVTLPNPSQPGFSQTPVSVQIDRYLAAGGAFDRHSLVTLLVGANDIFQGGPAAIVPAAQALVAQVARLQQAGASNIILVSLPDIGSTPAFGFGAGGAANAGTQAAVSYNGVLKQGLQQLRGNILFIDMFTLFRGVVADPGTYGIRTVAGVACMTPSSGQCTPATTVPDGAETYLFADSVHPTTAGHRILSDAVIAQLLAPSQISLLPLSVQSSLRGQQLSYDDRLYPNGGHTAHTIEWYGGVGYTPYKLDSSSQLNGIEAKNKAVTVVADYQLSETRGVGAALSYTDGKTEFGNNSGSFKTKLTSLGGYGRASHGPLYAYLNGAYGHFNLDDIRRNITLNAARRIESGSSQGGAVTLKAGTGYDFPLRAWVVGPILGFNYERIKVDGYGENGASSTQLTYGSQRLSQLTGSVGLQARLANESATWSPYVRLTYDYDMTHNGRTVSIASQSSVYPFQGMAFLPARASLPVTGGLTGKVAKHIALTVNVTSVLSQSHVSAWGLAAGLKLF